MQKFLFKKSKNYSSSMACIASYEVCILLY